MAETIVTQLERFAKADPQCDAFVFVDRNWKRTALSRHELWDLSRRFASILHKKGIRRGDVVCNTLPNSPERLVTQLGTILAGAIDMNGQICLADGEDFIFSMNQGRSNVIILDPNDVKGAIKILKPRSTMDMKVGGEVSCSDVPSLKMVIPCVFKRDSTVMSSLLEEIKREPDHVQRDIEVTEICTYMCTSGSTGFFKLVAFHSKCLLGYGDIFGRISDVSESSIYYNDRPLGWLGGHPCVYLAHGCTTVAFDNALGRPANYPEVVWEIFDREKCSCTYGVPQLMEMVTKAAKGRPHSSGHILEVYGCGSGPISSRHMETLGTVAKRIGIAYASTEGGAMATWEINQPDEFESFACGWPTTGSEIKIVNDELEELPRGQKGEVIFKTSHSAIKYVNDEANTEKTFLPGGWIRLGDIGFMNERGVLFVLGRQKFAIMRGPFIVYPDQLEMRIVKCPGVAGVLITGVPDEKNYEEICALVIPEDKANITTETVREFCEKTLFINEDNVEFNPMPKYFVFVESFPALVSGKLDRPEAKRIACKLLNLKL